MFYPLRCLPALLRNFRGEKQNRYNFYSYKAVKRDLTVKLTERRAASTVGDTAIYAL